MKRLNRPKITTEELFNSCYNSLSDSKSSARKARLKDAKESIFKESSMYEDSYKNGIFTSKIKPDTDIGNDINYMYEKKLVGGNKTNRGIYETLLRIDKTNLTCPFCRINYVSTLDHFIPKKKYPSFSITPDNLVGMCGDCNQKKLEHEPSNRNNMLFHPYFEEKSFSCLKGFYDVEKKDFRFIPRDKSGDDEFDKRAEFFVKKFELEERVNIHTVSLMIEIENLLKSNIRQLHMNGIFHSPEISIQQFLDNNVFENVYQEEIKKTLQTNDNFFHEIIRKISNDYI